MAIKQTLSNRRSKTALALLILAVACAAIFARYKKSKMEKKEGPSLAAVARGDLELRFKEIGDIAAKNIVNVASKVSGRVILLDAQEGSAVAQGQKLAVIQPGRTESERYLPSTVTAPISGVVMRCLKEGKEAPDAKFVEIADYVTGIFESQTPTCLMTIADMRQLVVRLKISEMDILKLQEKMPVTVAVDALKGSTFSATVSMIAPQAEKESSGGKVFRVEVRLNRVDRRLKTGMTARVDALLKKKQGVLKMPLAALFEEAGQTVAYLDAKPKPRQVKVTLGLRTELDAEIVSGLKENDKVCIEKPADFVALPDLKPSEGQTAATH